MNLNKIISNVNDQVWLSVKTGVYHNVNFPTYVEVTSQVEVCIFVKITKQIQSKISFDCIEYRFYTESLAGGYKK